MSWYSLCKNTVRVLYTVFHPIKVTGLENVPADGACVICANHRSFRDPLVIASKVSRKICFLSKKEIFDNKLVGWLFPRIKCIPVDRGANDLSAIRASLAALKNGEPIGIFPEGHRYTDGQMHEFQNGVALLVTRSKAPVVPMRIKGSYKLFHRVELVIGKPFTYEPIPGVNGSEQLNSCTRAIKEHIEEL